MFKFVFTKLRHTIKNWTDGEKSCALNWYNSESTDIIGLYLYTRAIRTSRTDAVLLFIFIIIIMVILLRPVQFTTTKTNNKLNKYIEQCFVGK